jgi:RNA polymerase sigma-70 factor (ECF subfamily)
MTADTKEAEKLIRSSQIDFFTGKDLKRPEVFTGLYRRFYDDIFRYCVHRLFDRHIAEDITSDVFFSAVEKIDSFTGTEIQFRNWLYKIATNAVNEHLRRKYRRESVIKIVAETSTEKTTEDFSAPDDENDKRLLLLKQAIFGLKPKYQAVITLRFFENLKLTEIAEILSKRPGTVRSQLARALNCLRKKIEPGRQEVWIYEQ